MKKQRLKYSLLNKKNCRCGRISICIAVVALALLIAAVYISFGHKGKAGAVVGYMGIAAFVVAMAGFIVGLFSFKEEEKNEFYGWLGSFANAFIWLFVVGIFLAFI